METAQKGCVYFIKLNGLSPIKIGYTTNESPQSRLKSFRTVAPYGATLVGYILSDNPCELERELHKKYKHARTQGEWFEITSEDVAIVCDKHICDKQRVEMSIIYDMYSRGLHKKPIERKKAAKGIVVFPDRLKDFLGTLDLDVDCRYNKNVITDKCHVFFSSTVISQRKLTQCFIEYFTNKGFLVIEGKSFMRWIMITVPVQTVTS